MYAVQLFQIGAYRTVDGPTGLEAAFDNYAAHVRHKAEEGTMVRLVRVEKGPKGLRTVELRKAKALAIPVAAYLVPVHVPSRKSHPLEVAVKRLNTHAPKKTRTVARKNHTARKAG